MKTLFHLRNASLALLLLPGGLLLGIRLYENAVLFGGDIPTVTHLITPMLWPAILLGAVLSAGFALAYGICRQANERARRRAER